MQLIGLMVLLLSLNVAYKMAHAGLQAPEKSNTTTTSVYIANSKENKTIIELNKDITFNTGLNLDKALAQLNGTEASYIPKIRKVTSVDNDSLDGKLKADINISSSNDKNGNVTRPVKTITEEPTQMKILSEGGVIDLKTGSAKNETENAEKVSKYTTGTASMVEEAVTKSITNGSNKTATPTAGSKDGTEIYNRQDKDGSTTTTTTKPIAFNTSTSTTRAVPSTTTITANNTSTMATSNSSISNSNAGSNTSTTNPTTSTITTITTTKTTTTTTPRPKKPTITYSIPDFPDLEKDNPELNNLLQSSASALSKLLMPDGPYAQPSQELNSNSFHRGRDFILPIVSMIFIIPLVIGILITSYRRFRDCWSTRHYRRMDFLVDGMYND